MGARPYGVSAFGVTFILCATLLWVSCGSDRDAAFRRAVGPVVSDAIGLREKLAFNGSGYDAEDLRNATAYADGILALYIEGVTALPQPDAKELRYLRKRLLSHAAVSRTRHDDFARYLGSYVDAGPGDVARIAERLEVMQRSDVALVHSTRLLAAAERIALGTHAVDDWIDAVGSEDWHGSSSEEVSESDSAAAAETLARREIGAMR